MSEEKFCYLRLYYILASSTDDALRFEARRCNRYCLEIEQGIYSRLPVAYRILFDCLVICRVHPRRFNGSVTQNVRDLV